MSNWKKKSLHPRQCRAHFLGGEDTQLEELVGVTVGKTVEQVVVGMVVEWRLERRLGRMLDCLLVKR